MSNTTSSPETFLYLDSSQMKIVSAISLLTSGLSFVGSASILICVGYHKRICATEVFPVFHLSLTDALASLFMVVVSLFFMNMKYDSFPGSPGPCGYLSAIMISLYISTFFLTLCYALEAFVRLRKRLQSYLSLEGSTSFFQRDGVSSYCMYLIYLLSWIVPLSLAIFLMLVTHLMKSDETRISFIIPSECSLCFPVFNIHDSICWTHVKEGEKWLLTYKLIVLLPLILVFLLNMVLYICIARDFRHVSMRRGLLSYHQRQEESTLRRKACLYQWAFLTCWIPTLILQFASFSGSFSMTDYYPVYILQALLGPLQGLLNCIIYGWRREHFRRALTESSHLLISHRGTMTFTL